METRPFSNESLFYRVAIIATSVILFSGLILSVNRSYAQGSVNANDKKASANFFEIQKQFYDQWKNKPITRGSGYKPFKRWEWFWEQRVDRSGNFPPNNIVVNERNRYDETHTTEQPLDSVAYWTPMGPNATKSGYFGLGRINCIAFHPSDLNTFWVGTPAGGLWKTTDFGRNWTTGFDSQPVLGVSDMVIDPNEPRVMYIATGDGDAAGAVGDINGSGPGDTKSIGVMKSVNGGVTWTPTALNPQTSESMLIRRLIMHPTNPGILYAATSKGIYKIFKGGDSLKLQVSGYFTDIVFKPGDSLVMYAATTEGKIFRTKNGGVEWIETKQFPGGTRIILAVNPLNNQLVEAICTNYLNGLLGIYRSTNGGDDFVKYYPNQTIDSLRPTQNLLCTWADTNKHGDAWKGQGNYDLCFIINPVDTNERWVGGVNTWKSINSGKTWTLVSYWKDTVACQTVHADKHWFTFHPRQPKTFMEGNDGGIYYTKDGGTKWIDITRGMQIGQIYRIGGSYTHKNMIIAGFQDNGTQVQNDYYWRNVYGGDGMDCLIDYTNYKVQYLTYCNGEIYRSTDPEWEDQKQIKRISDTIPGKPSGAWVTPYIMHPTDPNTLYAGYQQLFKTTNGGMSWIQANTIKFPKPVPYSDTVFKSIEISQSNPKIMYAARLYTLFRTENDWQEYKELKNPSGTDSCVITMIAIDPANPMKVWVTMGGYKNQKKVFRSIDGGENWQNISGSLPNLPVGCIKYQKNTNDALYIGTDDGIYYRNAGMTDWRRYSQGLPNVIVTDLEIQYMSGKIRASTFGRGLWESDLYVEPGFVEVNGVCMPINGGTVTGAGVYRLGDTVTMQAVPAKNWKFEGWVENDLSIADSSKTTFKFAAKSNRNLVAYFSAPVGIGEIPRNIMALYPNPSSGIVEVVVDKSYSQNMKKILVTGINGKTVYESVGKPAGDHFKIDLSHCATGTYIVTIFLESGSKHSSRLIIQR